MKIALVSDWLTQNAGAEKVVSAINSIYPDIDNYALIDLLSSTDRNEILNGKFATTTFLNEIPFLKHKFRNLFSIFPYLIEQFDLRQYDLVLSSSHCVAKGALTSSEQYHICYIHTPVRYAWDMYQDYIQQYKLNPLKEYMAKYFLYKLRQWDILSTQRVDHFITNSNFVANRVKKIYNRESSVIYPPVNTDHFKLSTSDQGYYIAVGRLVKYKRFDIIVDAFAKNKKQLVIIGDGEEMGALKKIASSNIEFLSRVDLDTLVSMIQGAKALIFAAKEDFGITPVEAMSCGKPVIYYACGGVCESVRQGIDGIGFIEQNSKSLNEAIDVFEKKQDSFDPKRIRERALEFDTKVFKQKIKKEIQNKYDIWKANLTHDKKNI